MLLDGCPDFVQAEDDYWQTLPGTGGNIHPLTDYIKPKIADLIDRGKSIVEEKKVEDKEKKNVHIPTIQERIREQAYDACEDIEVWLGKEKSVKAYVSQDIFKTIKKAKKRLLKISLKYDGPIEAPIKKNQKIGTYRVVYDQELIGEYDLSVSYTHLTLPTTPYV